VTPKFAGEGGACSNEEESVISNERIRREKTTAKEATRGKPFPVKKEKITPGVQENRHSAQS